MDAPSWMFTKALSHRQKVIRLFKRSSREVDGWYRNDVVEWRFQRVLLRARFDENKGVLDSAKRKALLVEGCKEIWEKKHPVTFAFAHDPFGAAYRRLPEKPDMILDFWDDVEMEQFPYYFARRELRKKELLSAWVDIEKSWDDKLEDMQIEPPKVEIGAKSSSSTSST